MKIPEWLAPIIVGVLFALQSWTLIEIVNLKVAVAKISGRLEIETQTKYEKTEKMFARNAGCLLR